MAKNTGNKLWLELGLDVSAFDAAFSAADSTANKRRKTINNSLSTITRKFQMQINEAKLSGDAERALALDTERLAAKVEVLKRAEENLLKMRERVRKGGNAKEIAQAEVEYQNAILRRQQMQIALKNQQDASGSNGVGNALKSLVANSRYGGVLASITENAQQLTAVSSSLGIALSTTVAGGFMAAVAAAGGYFQLLKSITKESEDAAVKAAALGEETYKMKERLSLDEKSANRLSDIFRLDGTDADAVLKKLDSLGAALLAADEEGTKAEQALNRYGESLRNADGSMKDAEQMLLAIAAAHKKAEEAGLGYQLLAETSMGKYSGLIAGFDDLIERADGMTRAFGATTKVMHEMSDRQADLELHTKKLDEAMGSDAAAVRIKVLENENRLLEDQIKFKNKNQAAIQAYEERIGFLTQKVDIFSSAWEKVKLRTKAALGEGIMLFDANREHVDSAADRELQQQMEDKRKKDEANRVRAAKAQEAKERATLKANVELQHMVWEIKASDYDKEIAKIEEVAEEKRAEGADEVHIAEYVATAKAKAEEKLNKKLEEERKKREQEQKRILAEYKKQEQERINAERQIQSVLQSGLQNRLQQIEREKEAWIKAGADEVSATIAAEKQKADARKAEADARKSEAEKALTSQKKLWRAYLRMGDTPEFQQYALKQQLKSMGISKKDYASMNMSTLTGFTNAMKNFKDNTWFSQLNGAGQNFKDNTWFSQLNGAVSQLNGAGNEAMNKFQNKTWFSQLNGAVSQLNGAGNTAVASPVSNVNNNTITINFDNTVLDNVSAMDVLANKVADIIQPAIEKAIKGQGAKGAYGY